MASFNWQANPAFALQDLAQATAADAGHTADAFAASATLVANGASAVGNEREGFGQLGPTTAPSPLAWAVSRVRSLEQRVNALEVADAVLESRLDALEDKDRDATATAPDRAKGSSAAPGARWPVQASSGAGERRGDLAATTAVDGTAMEENRRVAYLDYGNMVKDASMFFGAATLFSSFANASLTPGAAGCLLGGFACFTLSLFLAFLMRAYAHKADRFRWYETKPLKLFWVAAVLLLLCGLGLLLSAMILQVSTPMTKVVFPSGNTLQYAERPSPGRSSQLGGSASPITLVQAPVMAHGFALYSLFVVLLVLAATVAYFAVATRSKRGPGPVPTNISTTFTYSHQKVV